MTGAATSLLLLATGTLAAQEDKPPFSIMLGGSMTGEGDVESSGTLLGEVETTRYKVEATYSVPSEGNWSFEIGGTYEALETDHSHVDSLLPENLTAVSLNLQAMWRISNRWAFIADVEPGFYGDDEVDFSDAFNAPLTLLGRWQKSDDLSVMFGLRVNAFSDSVVLPVLGVAWEINPEWELVLGVPRTELRYQWSEQLSLYGGVALEGSSYAVDDPSVTAPGGAPLRDTYVSESEIRGLIGMEYRFDSGVKLSVEGGYAFEREFDYHDEDVKLEVDPGAFGAVSVSFSF